MIFTGPGFPLCSRCHRPIFAVDVVLLSPHGRGNSEQRRARWNRCGSRSDRLSIDRSANNPIAEAMVLTHFEGRANAASELIIADHRHIAFVCSPASLHTHLERPRRYRHALREAGITDTPQWVRVEGVSGPGAEESGRDPLALREPWPAKVARSSRASCGVVRALDNRFERAAFIGFDDFELPAASGITVVASDAAGLRRQAARPVVGRLDDPIGPPQQIEVPTRPTQHGRAKEHVPLLPD